MYERRFASHIATHNSMSRSLTSSSTRSLRPVSLSSTRRLRESSSAAPSRLGTSSWTPSFFLLRSVTAIE